MKILVTGGTGYIGSHTCVELIKSGFEVIVVDNLSNSSIKSLKRVEQITKNIIPFYKIDVNNKFELINIFEKYKIDGVIHFAGLKAIGDSVKNPIQYYNNNVCGTLSLIDAMRKFNCKILIFSSSATVYGNPDTVPIKENFPLFATNPYARSKIILENLLKDIFIADEKYKIGVLRYFNPIGAHESGLIGEDPKDIPNNLIPYISQVAIGKLKKLKIFGGDYNTQDGTGIRDYIHVVDLAKGHVKALKLLFEKSQLLTVNLGTGKGYSVLEIVNAFEKASGRVIPYEIVDRRSGDVDKCYADISYASKKLNWKAQYGLDEMCKDSWNWQLRNPRGYE